MKSIALSCASVCTLLIQKIRVGKGSVFALPPCEEQANLSLRNSTLMLLLFRVLKERKERKEVWNNEEEAEVGCKGLCKRWERVKA